MKHRRLITRFIKLLGCDTARIITPLGTMFLIIGYKRNTKDDRGPGRWLKNGKPWDHEYLHERVVASGETVVELIASVEHYKKLLGMTMERWLYERVMEAAEAAGDKS